MMFDNFIIALPTFNSELYNYGIPLHVSESIKAHVGESKCFSLLCVHSCGFNAQKTVLNQ